MNMLLPNPAVMPAAVACRSRYQGFVKPALSYAVRLMWSRMVRALLLIRATVALADPVTLDVTFKITDLDYKPLPGVNGRVVFGCDKDWQAPNTGQTFISEGNGEARFTADVTLDKRWQEYPTNFIDSLFSSPQLTDHLTVAAELEYMTFRWLYALDLFRFPNGATLLDDFRIYTRDERGHFTNRAEQVGTDWKIRELKGMLLTAPGYEPWDHSLAPDPADPSGRRWTLRIGFKKSPPPLQR